MALDTVVNTFNGKKVLPAYDAEDARELPVNLAPSTVYPRGTLLGAVAASANDVQTLTVTGTPTGGSITVTAVHPISGNPVTFNLLFNNTTGTSQTAARAALGAGVTVTGGTLPGATQIFTFAGDAAAMPVTLMTVSTNALTGGTTPTAAFAHTTVGARANTFAPYVDTTATDPAVAILSYDCATDAAGNVSLGLVAGAGQFGGSSKDAPAWFSGYFFTSDLVGYDAAAAANLGKILPGGVLCITGA